MELKKYKFWFITGTQTLYGAEVIAQVEKDSRQIITSLNESSEIIGEIVFKGAVIHRTGSHRCE